MCGPEKDPQLRSITPGHGPAAVCLLARNLGFATKPGDIAGLVLLEVFPGCLPEAGAKHPVELGIAAEPCVERRAEQIAALRVYPPEEPRETQLVAVLYDGCARVALERASELPRTHMNLSGKGIARKCWVAPEQLRHLTDERVLRLLWPCTRANELRAHGFERAP